MQFYVLTWQYSIFMNHFLINKYNESIELVSNDPDQYKKQIPTLIGYEFSKNINQQHRLRIRLPWVEIHSCYKTDGIHEISALSDKLLKSELCTRKWIILFYGKNVPVLKVKTEVFCKNWNSFMAASGHQGFFGFSEDGRLLIEFTDDDNESVYSNFKI